ncbi:hypothetical protein MTR67_051531 [Solanum verrucosum]|uniref:Uncharacterized protein n=1 Tax=Solanum verrucosum TaxID=315347 RepID=A0AAF0V7G4_SOLVR|nr:hypothetical protein MTR67_051531 [Solanum verrucosum]
MGDEISSKFREERAITGTLIDSKIAAMEQRLSEKIVQVIQEQLSRLGVGSTKPATHRPESYSAQTTGRSTIPATKGNTPPIQLADKNHTTSGYSPLIVPSYAKMNFPTLNNINNPLIWAHHCEQYFEQFGPHEGLELDKLILIQIFWMIAPKLELEDKLFQLVQEFKSALYARKERGEYGEYSNRVAVRDTDQRETLLCWMARHIVEEGVNAEWADRGTKTVDVGLIRDDATSVVPRRGIPFDLPPIGETLAPNKTDEGTIPSLTEEHDVTAPPSTLSDLAEDAGDVVLNALFGEDEPTINPSHAAGKRTRALDCTMDTEEEQRAKKEEKQ